MLESLLGSETRARVLSVLLARPRSEHHLRELIRLTGSGASGVQREVERLERLGLIASEYTPEGRRVISVVDQHELLAPLQALVDAEVAGAGGATPASRSPASDEVAPRAHPLLRPRLPAVLAALRDAGVERAVLFGSASQTGPAAPTGPAGTPHDLDILVRLGGKAKGRAARYFTLRQALERASGLPVDLVEEEAVANPYLRDEIERTGVVLLAAA